MILTRSSKCMKGLTFITWSGESYFSTTLSNRVDLWHNMTHTQEHMRTLSVCTEDLLRQQLTLLKNKNVREKEEVSKRLSFFLPLTAICAATQSG